MVTRVYGAHWQHFVFGGICALPSYKQREARSTAHKVSLFHHVSNSDDTHSVCLLSHAHESFDIKLFLYCLKKSETTKGIVASY